MRIRCECFNINLMGTQQKCYVYQFLSEDIYYGIDENSLRTHVKLFTNSTFIEYHLPAWCVFFAECRCS